MGLELSGRFFNKYLWLYCLEEGICWVLQVDRKWGRHSSYSQILWEKYWKSSVKKVVFKKKVKVKVTQSCDTVCDPMDYTIHGILQARTLEWVAFPFSRDLPNPGIKPRSPALWAGSLPAEPQRSFKLWVRFGWVDACEWSRENSR